MAGSKYTVAIVIPIYKKKPSASELLSIKGCAKILGKYPFVVIAPEGLDLDYYRKYNFDFEVHRFEKKYFEGIEGYNQLLLSEEFYLRFMPYKYILIYQLDVLVFKDSLPEWIKKNYDYVGAPWIKSSFHIFLNLLVKISAAMAIRFVYHSKGRNQVGNGGLSLRKSDAFINACRQNKDALQKWRTNEDYYWSFFAKVDGKRFRIPDWKEAVNFSIETQSNIAIHYLKDKVPFGVHAWEKYDKSYWFNKLKETVPEIISEEKYHPKISIITVSLNACDALAKTIESVQRQTYKHLEFIVIDGGSTDQTIDLIRKKHNTVIRWISEKDNGIYNAMNKGLRMATGDFVWFINAGDEIYEEDTIEKVFDKEMLGDVYFGQAMIVNDRGNEIGLRRLKPPEKLTWRSFQMGQVVCHQSFIAKKELVPFYDEKYVYSSDTDWQIKTMKKANVIVNTHQILCKFLSGGRSSKTIVPSITERFQIMIKNFGLLKTVLNHFLITVKFFSFLIRHRRF